MFYVRLRFVYMYLKYCLYVFKVCVLVNVVLFYFISDLCLLVSLNDDDYGEDNWWFLMVVFYIWIYVVVCNDLIYSIG